jgi:CheY-like chemotaxis protein
MSTILVVDDDPGFFEEVEKMLSSAGYRVLHAADGNQALRTLERQHDEIDLTIIDLALPGLNGFELIGAIARRPNPVKVIATTSVYKDQHLEVAATLGAHAAIRKPAQGQPLPQMQWLATVRRLLGNGRETNAVNPAHV